MYVDKILAGIKAADALAAQPRLSQEARRLRARFHERRGYDPVSLRGLLPHDDPLRRDRPRQAPRPQGGARWRPGLFGGAGRAVGRALSGAGRDALDLILDARVADYRSTLDEDGQVELKGALLPRAHLRLPGPGVALYQRGLGEALDLLNPGAQAAGARGGGSGAGDPRGDRHGQLPRREACGDQDRLDEDAEIGPVPVGDAGRPPEPEMEHLLGDPQVSSTISSATSPGPMPTASGA